MKKNPMSRRSLLLLFVTSTIFIFRVSGNIKLEKLFINRGVFTTVKQTAFPYLAFNETANFGAKNKVISATTNDSVFITIYNNDSVLHGFEIINSSLAPLTINPGDSATTVFNSQEEKICLYYDPLDYPSNAYLGLAGMICISNSTTEKKFYWNLREHQTLYNQEIVTGNIINWKNYRPDYFTVNGLSFPDLQTDSSAVVNANTGDTVLIFVANTGRAMHSIHFHGFHCKTVYSTCEKIPVNSEKDTFPFPGMEGAILLMVADKTGKYSVHDHNLVAVSGGGTHPNGMFLIMEIK